MPGLLILNTKTIIRKIIIIMITMLMLVIILILIVASGACPDFVRSRDPW